jgi:hypothetical protein
MIEGQRFAPGPSGAMHAVRFYIVNYYMCTVIFSTFNA